MGKADITLYPVVKQAKWITYDTNGGSIVNPDYVLYNGKTVEPKEPTKRGYTFDGWYTDKDCTSGNEFTFGDTLASDITLYAKWTAAEASYKVVFWQQQVTDAKDAKDANKKYDYVTSEVRYADTGSDVSVTYADKSMKTGTRSRVGHQRFPTQ